MATMARMASTAVPVLDAHRLREDFPVFEELVDGRPVAMELRADYLVEAGAELLVAEVKTGDEAPSIGTAATRRQLLEYHVAFGVDGVLLVCPEHGTIHRVVFPLHLR